MGVGNGQAQTKNQRRYHFINVNAHGLLLCNVFQGHCAQDHPFKNQRLGLTKGPSQLPDYLRVDPKIEDRIHEGSVIKG